MFRLPCTLSFAAGLRCVTLCAFALGCAGGSAADTGSEHEPVVGGTASGKADDAVVRLVSRQPDPYADIACTGVLLAPNVLLTALHCAAVFDGDASFACQPNGSVAPGYSGGWIGVPLDPGSIEVYFGDAPTTTLAARGARVFGSGSTAACIDDIAFVVLDTALPSRGLPVRTARPVVAGELMTIIGFGLNDLPDVPRARRSGVPVLVVGPDDTSHGLGTVAPRTFLVGDGPCSGDDGSPALSDETGAVTGIFSLNYAGDCEQSGTSGWFTEVAPFTSLLHDAFEAAGGEPQEEATPAEAPAPARISSCALAPNLGEPGSAATLLGALLVAFARRRSKPVRSRTRGGEARNGWRRRRRSRRASEP